MIWIKTLAGIHCWMGSDKFSREKVENYYLLSFVYHLYNVIINTIMFGFQTDFYGKWTIPNIVGTLILAFACTKFLHSFLRFKDRENLLHQKLWCGDVVDSSDEEEKARAKFGQVPMLRCS